MNLLVKLFAAARSDTMPYEEWSPKARLVDRLSGSDGSKTDPDLALLQDDRI